MTAIDTENEQQNEQGYLCQIYLRKFSKTWCINFF